MPSCTLHGANGRRWRDRAGERRAWKECNHVTLTEFEAERDSFGSSDADGRLRVGGHAVTLDTLVSAFGDGATAEEIVQQYPVLAPRRRLRRPGLLLRERARQVDAYLRQRRADAEAVRERESRRRFDPQGVRERLLARRGEPRPVPHAQAAR